MNPLFDKTAPKNVHGWERAVSVAGGLVLVGKGLRRGGVLGLFGMVMGGLALVRGMSGRCEFKRALQQRRYRAPEAKARYAHMPLDSEVHSPDFEDVEALPDTTPMGHETHAEPRRLNG
jgi:uncharacterized membrane protein